MVLRHTEFMIGEPDLEHGGGVVAGHDLVHEFPQFVALRAFARSHEDLGLGGEVSLLCSLLKPQVVRFERNDRPVID